MALVIVGPSVGRTSRVGWSPMVRKSPLALHLDPSASGSRGSVFVTSRDRSRSSVDPSEPAATTSSRADSVDGADRAAVDPVQVDGPAVGRRLDRADERERPDVDAVRLRQGEVVEVQRVAGEDRAADVALAEVDARPLLAALGVGEPAGARRVLGVRVVARPGRVEGHRQLELPEPVAVAGRRGGLGHQRGPRRPLASRHRLDVHRPRDGLVVREQLLVGDLGRPAGLEGRRVGLHADVGVDQRSAADRGALGDGHPPEHPEVQPAVALLRVELVPQPRIAGLARERGRVPAAPALEDHHAIARLGEAAGRDRAAEPRADDDGVGGHSFGGLWLVVRGACAGGARSGRSARRAPGSSVAPAASA